MTVNRDTEHNFVEIDVTFRGDGKFEITMKDYLQETIDTFPEIISRLINKNKKLAKGDWGSWTNTRQQRKADVCFRIYLWNLDLVRVVTVF